RFLGSNVTESPGDVEASQDIFWDATSPTHTGRRNKNTRAVKISDIANRIAPKNIKPKVTESLLLHWMDDGAIPCTPDVPKQRVRKRSSRCEIPIALSSLKVSHTIFTYRKPRCPSLSEQAEAELRALFDSSTQGISGRLSEGSVSSQDRQDLVETFAFIDQRQSEPKPADKHSTNNLVDFEDDWDNDDLLNDSLILALTQDPSNPPKTSAKSHTNTTELASALQSTSNKKPENPCKTSFCLLQDLCPKTKTRNRSTFKLESNPHFQTMLDKEAAKFGSTAIQPKSKSTEQKRATTKTDSNPQCEKVTNGAKFFLPASSVKDVSDSLWDDGDDDALLYQVCASVERVSNSQPDEASLKLWEGQKLKGPVDGRQNMRDCHVSAESSGSSGVGANRRSSGSFIRSHSLPLTSCKTGNYQGWNIPLKGGNNKSGISQRFPGSQVDPGGDFSHGNVAMKPHPAMTRVAQNSMSQHAAFKRNVSDSAIINNKGKLVEYNKNYHKSVIMPIFITFIVVSLFFFPPVSFCTSVVPVFVTSQTAGKCSAAEIERKKQEALARRRLRMQNASNL
uniref:ETAA1 activator of ATR kinase n=1 Tax=Xiphophorus couchianus TaxID=32473 RepID=A0A3B5LIG3_9TELE